MSLSRSHSPNPYTNPHSHTHSHSQPFAQFTAAAAAARDSLQTHPSYDPSYFPLSDDSYFDEAITAYRSSLSPPPPNNSFLDNILNPVSHSHSHSHSQPTESGYTPRGYRQRISPPRRRPRSALPQTHRAPMSPSHPPRLPNGYVDLTTPDPTPVRRKRNSVTPGPSAKRARHTRGTSATDNQEPTSPDTKIEEIDLSEDRVSVAEILQKQRADAVKAQTRPEEKPTTLNSFTCVICMDTPTDITATSCGEYPFT